MYICVFTLQNYSMEKKYYGLILLRTNHFIGYLFLKYLGGLLNIRLKFVTLFFW